MNFTRKDVLSIASDIIQADRAVGKFASASRANAAVVQQLVEEFGIKQELARLYLTAADVNTLASKTIREPFNSVAIISGIACILEMASILAGLSSERSTELLVRTHQLADEREG